MNLNKTKLKWMVFSILLGFCALLLVTLWLFQTVFLKDMYKAIRKRELNLVISNVEKEIENLDLHDMFIQIEVENDIFVSYTRDFAVPQWPRRGIPGRGNEAPFETITEEREFILPNGQPLSLTFYAMLTPVNATVTTLRVQLFIISGVMLLLAVAGALLIVRKISKPLNAAATEIKQAEGLRRELMANVSHDLRTPLALIYSYAEMMNDFPGEITAEQTTVIMDETQRLTALVNDVLDISKLESDMESCRPARFNLTRSIGETVERVQKLLKNEGFTIIFNHDGEVFTVADETKIGRAFYNLLVNAVNYSGDSRVVEVVQTTANGRVRISVTDSGEGIAEDDLPFIWDRYYKNSKTHKRAVTGTGLGLSIVKKIIELHGGQYGVLSEVGKGSTFWFEIDMYP